MSSEARMKKEWGVFQEMLPELCKTLKNRWVVFFDGKVRGDYSDEDEAFEAAVGEFGPDGGFVVARVEKLKATPITAAVVYGF